MQIFREHFGSVASEFDALSERDFVKVEHLTNRMKDLRLQALQLIWSAMREGDLPEFRNYVESNVKELETLGADPQFGALHRL